jgi:soluble lytic murein transglycosylase-like protein
MNNLLRRFGVVLHGHKIWISELIAGLFVSLTLISFSFVCVFIVKSEIAIHRNIRACAALRAENNKTTQMLSQLRSQERIARALKGAIGGTISPTGYYQLVDLVYTNSRTYGYDPLLVLAVIQVESFFEPTALGRYKNNRLSGALGLMQVKPETAREIADNLGIPIKGDADLFKPEINLVIGVAYLTKLIGSFKSFKLGLLAYNQGPGVIKGRLQEKQPLSIAYYDRVLKKYYALKKTVDPHF